jgi:GNAT superfamily N-acetyltransferase
VIQVLETDLTLPEHASVLIQLMDEYALDPMNGSRALSEFARENLVSELKKCDAAHVILAFVDGKPAGLVTCLEGFSTFACRPLLNVHDVIVSAEYRGRGLCKRMLEVAEPVAHRLGCCKMMLEVLEGMLQHKRPISPVVSRVTSWIHAWGRPCFGRRSLR